MISSCNCAHKWFHAAKWHNYQAIFSGHKDEISLQDERTATFQVLATCDIIQEYHHTNNPDEFINDFLAQQIGYKLPTTQRKLSRRVIREYRRTIT